MEDLSQRIRGRITEDNWRALNSASSRKGKSRDRLINAALSCYFSFERDDMRDARIITRLDIMTRHFHQIHRDTQILIEMQALFVLYFFTLAPQYSAADQDARAAKGVSLLNDFIDELSKRMNDGSKAVKKALDRDVKITQDEFLTDKELEYFASLSSKKRGDAFG